MSNVLSIFGYLLIFGCDLFCIGGKLGNLGARGLGAKVCGGAAVAGEALTLYAALLFGKLVHDCDHDTKHKESAGSLCKNRNSEVIECYTLFGSLEEEVDGLDAEGLKTGEYGARTEDLTDDCHCEKCNKEADTHSKSVKCGIKGTVLSCEHFRSAKNDTVYNDKRQPNAEKVVNRLNKCVQQHLNKRNKRRNNDDVAGDTHGVGNNLAKERDYNVGAEEYDGSRKAHRDCRYDVDLRPFELAFAEGMPGVMVAHLKVPSLDPAGTPASLSKKITTDFLQDSLGFKGLIFTDALAMKGASRVNENNCVSAFLAGADILLGSAAPSSDLDAVEDAVKSGKISQIELNRRCKKVLVYKYKLGLSTKPTKIESSVLSSKLHTPQVDKLLTNLSRKAITVVSDNARLLPIDKSKKVVVVSLGAPGSNKFSDLCKEYCGADRYGKLSATVLSEIKSADVVIVGVFNSSVETKNALSTIVAANSSTVGVFFMNPYRVSKFSNLKSLSSIVLAYDDIPHLRTAAAEALAGKINVTGKLPINLPSVGKIGDGVVINKK